MVQIEAMISGTPVVASDLPGVRCPVEQTGMGRIVPTRNAEKLGEAIVDVLDCPQCYSGDVTAIRHSYSPITIARQYEALFKELIEKR